MSADLHAQVQRRLARVAEAWSPTPVTPASPRARRRLTIRLDRRGWRALLAMVAAAGLVAGWMWWQGRPRPVVLAPALTVEGTPMHDASSVVAGGEVVVHVTGAVRSPGLIHLPAGSRVDDAITAAGGVRTAKALASVNLARQVVDGEQIVVGAAPASSGSADQGVNLNEADAAALDALPGIGPVLAGRIVDWRTKNGPFRSVDELGEVSGIGDAMLGRLRAMVHV